MVRAGARMKTQPHDRRRNAADRTVNSALTVDSLSLGSGATLTFTGTLTESPDSLTMTGTLRADTIDLDGALSVQASGLARKYNGDPVTAANVIVAKTSGGLDITGAVLSGRKAFYSYEFVPQTGNADALDLVVLKNPINPSDIAQSSNSANAAQAIQDAEDAGRVCASPPAIRAGLEWRLRERLTITADYEGRFRSHRRTHAASFGAVLSF